MCLIRSSLHRDTSAPMKQSSRTPVSRTDTWQPLLNRNGGVILQIANNEPLARILLDETLSTGGYVAVSTIHFSQNFLFFLPYLYQYRYSLPFIALQDAHGPESWWWIHELMGYRTLFLATEPTYEGMMKALKNNWVVAVRHDAVSHNKTRMLGGAPGVQEYILAHHDQWQWWDSDSHKVSHPNGVITFVTPADSFEVGRPDKGVNIRIRCLWESNRQFLKNPIYTLERLLVNGRGVQAKSEESKQRNQLLDSYYLYSLPEVPADGFEVQAIIRNKDTGERQALTARYRGE